MENNNIQKQNGPPPPKPAPPLNNIVTCLTISTQILKGSFFAYLFAMNFVTQAIDTQGFPITV